MMIQDNFHLEEYKSSRLSDPLRGTKAQPTLFPFFFCNFSFRKRRKGSKESISGEEEWRITRDSPWVVTFSFGKRET